MRIIETKVYKFEELSDKAKERARDWFRTAIAGDSYCAEYVTNDFKETLAALGFSVNRNRGHDAIYWSGFSSQGDGAAFEASWSASAIDRAKLAAFLADRPAAWVRDGKDGSSKENAELHRIAGTLTAIADKYPDAGGNASSPGYRYHNQRADFDSNDGPEYSGMNDGPVAEFASCVTDLAHNFYRALEADYEYQNSDVQVDENIICNEYEFTEEGNRS